MARKPLPLIRRIAFAFLTSVRAASWGVIALWIAGAALSDRFQPLQWLAWLPSVVVVVAAAVALASAALSRSRRSIMVWSAALGLGLGLAILLEHRLWRSCASPSDADTIEILNWNLRWVGEERAEAFWTAVEASHREVSLLSNPGRLLLGERGKRWTDRGLSVVVVGDFVLLSSIEIIEARSLTGGARDVEIALFRLRTDAGAPLTIVAVDMPSDLAQGRMGAALQARAVLDRESLPEPYLAIGDFNATPGAASVRAMFPGFTDAFRTAGCGWSGTFPRTFPLWRIDQALAGPGLEVQSCELIDLGLGDHRAQRLHVRATTQSGRADPAAARATPIGAEDPR
jgi:hypothetical protein